MSIPGTSGWEAGASSDFRLPPVWRTNRWIDACIDKVVNWYIKLLSGRNPKLLDANTYKPFGSEISIYILKIVWGKLSSSKGVNIIHCWIPVPTILR